MPRRVPIAYLARSSLPASATVSSPGIRSPGPAIGGPKRAAYSDRRDREVDALRRPVFCAWSFFRNGTHHWQPVPGAKAVCELGWRPAGPHG